MPLPRYRGGSERDKYSERVTVSYDACLVWVACGSPVRCPIEERLVSFLPYHFHQGLTLQILVLTTDALCLWQHIPINMALGPCRAVRGHLVESTAQPRAEDKDFHVKTA